MNLIANARRLRREQTDEEKQLWRALRAGRFAGFKFRRQHPLGKYYLDVFCPLARLSVAAIWRSSAVCSWGVRAAANCRCSSNICSTSATIRSCKALSDLSEKLMVRIGSEASSANGEVGRRARVRL